jgi:glycosyltransferase involved in cell wall biosynthesis
MDFTLFLAVSVLVIVTLSVADLCLGVRSMTKLSEVPLVQDELLPVVSVVVPACNEEEKIEQAILSLLQQDYENLEIIAVDDRSTDGTGGILDRVQLQNSKLRVFHLESLPQGWMGKNNALKFGADRAIGDYLLFTDGDINMEKSTISRAVNHMISEKLDHISLIFKNTSPGIVLNSLILDAGIGLLQCFRPWCAKKKSSRNFMGVGAFNLLKRSVYLNIDGFESIKMHPVDDIMLGKVIKRNGFHQECLLGHDMVTVPWYDNVGQMVDGLIKNILAIVSYRFSLVPLLLSILFIFNMLPLWGMLFCDVKAGIFFSFIVLVRMALFYAGSRLLLISPWCVLGAFVSPYIIFYIVLRATWLNARDKGIYWRHTYYSLADLRANDRLLF